VSTKDSTWEVECCDNPHNSKGIPDLIVNPQPQLSMSILLSIHNFLEIQQIALVKDPKEENCSKEDKLQVSKLFHTYKFEFGCVALPDDLKIRITRFQTK